MNPGTYELTPFEPLAQAILDQAPDVELFNLAAESMYRRVGVSYNGTTQTMADLKESMCHELSGSVFLGVKGFWKKYLVDPEWSTLCAEIADSYVKRSGEEKLKFPTELEEASVWKWMKAVEKEIFKSSSNSNDSELTGGQSSRSSKFTHVFHGSQYHTLAAGNIIGGQTDNQVDYFIERRDTSAEDKHHWRNIVVVGELTKSSPSRFLGKFLQLSVYMSEVFSAQPLRRFVHGFILFGTQLQLWVYDRPGPYSCSLIDISKSQRGLVHALAAYMLMSDEEHGIDPSIQHHDDKIVIKLQVPGTNHKQEFALETEPFEWQKAPVSCGTCCYCNIDKKFVVKFSWRMTGRNSEAELLKLTTNVVGMAKLLGWRHLETIGNLQKGLEFTRQMVKDCRPKEKSFATPTVFVEKQVSVPKKSTSKTVVQKRKSESNYCGGINGSASKRARSSKNG
ncbi:BgTH12-06249 [Blumeria graminis f. sp. triticale]|uniref:BgTH12-06249 n=1 Tax=Blumeria graminis f. sp. triticale TaxID=1689686 RepID=A0A9W4CXU9_BLUGR|nr:BgTH12-06249 [Blumeria graminis f. sp. triticale]